MRAGSDHPAHFTRFPRRLHLSSGPNKLRKGRTISSIQYANWAPSQINNELTHKASELTEVGDLTFFDSSGVVRSAANFTDQGSAEPTQRLFATLFTGWSDSRQLSTDGTARPAKLIIASVIEYPCASTTVEIGDYFAPTYTAGVLSSQQLTKVSDPSLAVAKAVKRYTSATTVVKVRMISPVLSGPDTDLGKAALAVAPAFVVTRSTVANGGTVSAAQMAGRVLFQDASGGAVTMTTRTAAQIAGDFPTLAIGAAIPLFVASNHATNTSTISGGTNVTLVGSGAVTQTGGTFLLIKTANTPTFDLVRVA